MNSSRPDLNLLLAFEALLTERNVTRAAKRLHLSQPALSQQLARLRTVFNDQLFVPAARGVVPTARAIELQEPLRLALDQARALVGHGRAFDPSTAETTFSIAASDYVQITILLPFLLELHGSAPNVRVMVRLGDSRTAAAELERGDVDVAFLQPEKVGDGLRQAVLFTEDYVGICRKGLLEGDADLSLDEFTARAHVIVSPRAEGFVGPTDVALEQIGRERRVVFALSSFVFLIEAVANSDLLALAPGRLASRNLDRVDEFRPPVKVPGFTIAMAWHDRTQEHPGCLWLRNELVQFCKFEK
jgi:DNA-binding transcriptional LysR family regulator